MIGPDINRNYIGIKIRDMLDQRGPTVVCKINGFHFQVWSASSAYWGSCPTNQYFQRYLASRPLVRTASGKEHVDLFVSRTLILHLYRVFTQTMIDHHIRLSRTGFDNMVHQLPVVKIVTEITPNFSDHANGR